MCSPKYLSEMKDAAECCMGILCQSQALTLELWKHPALLQSTARAAERNSTNRLTKIAGEIFFLLLILEQSLDRQIVKT